MTKNNLRVACSECGTNCRNIRRLERHIFNEHGAESIESARASLGFPTNMLDFKAESLWYKLWKKNKADKRAARVERDRIRLALDLDNR